jgi:chorismate-pyruvate lyase
LDAAYPLTEFFSTAPQLDMLPGEKVPEPYRTLLVNEDDMTPVLEAHHHQTMTLRVLRKKLESQVLLREVLLIGAADSVVAAFGAIWINLVRFDDASRAMILECRLPLGAILHHREIAHSSRPTAFFRIRHDAQLRQALGPQPAEWLYGRHNRLLDAQQETLAEVVEILPAASPKR